MILLRAPIIRGGGIWSVTNFFLCPWVPSVYITTMAPATPNPNPFAPLSDEANAQRRADLKARKREAAARKEQGQGNLAMLQEYLHRLSTHQEGQIQSQAPQPSIDVDALVQQTAALKTKDSQGTPEPDDSMQ